MVQSFENDRQIWWPTVYTLEYPLTNHIEIHWKSHLVKLLKTHVGLRIVKDRNNFPQNLQIKKAYNILENIKFG